MTFWIAAGLLALACLAPMLRALLDAPASDTATRGTASDRSPDGAIYRDQLTELERDAARGTLAPEEAHAVRAEVARRLLTANRDAQAPGRRGAAAPAIAALAVIVLGVAFATYAGIGAPGYEDRPLAGRIAAVEAARADRPGQATAEAVVPVRPAPTDVAPETMAMVERLRAVLAERPDDLRGWSLAARFEAGLNDNAAAWRAQDRVVALKADDATADDFVILAEQMILAAGGYVSPEAERALAEAEARDPTHRLARFYAGHMYAQQGRADLAWPIWRNLIADSPPDAPWLPEVLARIEGVSRLAGDPSPVEDLTRPAGPSRDAIAAAQAMTPQERMEMIDGMVTGLAERLASEGGPPEDWGRLIAAYGVLGRTDAAAAIYEEAKQAFATAPAALDLLADAAAGAGLAR